MTIRNRFPNSRLWGEGWGKPTETPNHWPSPCGEVTLGPATACMLPGLTEAEVLDAEILKCETMAFALTLSRDSEDRVKGREYRQRAAWLNELRTLRVAKREIW